MNASRRARVAAWAVPVVLLAGCGATGPAPSPEPPAGPAAVSAAPGAAPPAPAVVAGSRPDQAPVVALAPGDPVDVAVPAIGVRTGPLLRLGLDDHGALEVPPDAGTAGWFTLGPPPGAPGPAVVAGHVDYGGVPGVFHRLHALAPGDEIRVTRADGTTAAFAAYRVEHHPKSAFPSERVYGDTAGPELRLITCGGSFDDRTGQYRDNVVVYARLRVP